MTPFQLALLKLSEECNEVGQSTSKNMQFGYTSVCPKTGLTNKQQLHMELNDIIGCIQLLNNEYDLGYTVNQDAVEKRILKIKHYMEYSVREGFVTK